ncbi:MAG: LysR family transcriptional regulator [Oscillospiraceae bacterium]|nr:LysR family transcriptional regulator [Oscillospiraceae bacterium]
MIDVRHKTFLALCRIGSYTKTAEHLGITQPAVSQHIKYLERQYGGALFARRGKKITRTERGERLYEFVRTVDADSAYLQQSLCGLGTRKNTLAFGATLSIGEYVMPQILLELLQDTPEATFHMQVGNTQALLGKLQAGEIQFALLEGFFPKADYDWRLLSREDFIAVCAPESPLAGREVQLSDILHQRLFIREEGSGTREVFAQILREHSHTLESFGDLCVIGNLNVLKSLVRNNLGITFLYAVAARQELAAGTLRQIQIRDFTVRRAFHFVFLKDSRHKEEYLAWFRAFAAAMGRGHQEAAAQSK